MNTYLRFLNPILAAAVFLICFWAACVDPDHDSTFQIKALIKGGLPTYFFAKGLFCGPALFLLGQMLLVLKGRRE